MKQKITKKQIAICLIGGIFVGFLNGFFGGGGGMVVVPLLIFLVGLQEKHAHATAILSILPISFASAIVYIVNGNINFSNLSFVTTGFVVGGVVGALLLKKLNNKLLRLIFAVVVIIAGIKMVF